MTLRLHPWRWTLALAAFLSALSPAFAQRGGYHGGGGHPTGGGYHGGSQYHGGGYHGNYYHGGYGRYPYYGYRPGFALAIGLGGLYGGYGGYYGGGYPYYSNYGAYNYPYAGGYAAYPTGDLSYYYPSTTANALPDPAPPPAGEARIRVILPTADAHVWFNDTLTTTAGQQRQYRTRPLQPNRSFSYTIRARWNENGQAVERTQVVTVQAGQISVADFTQPETVGPPAGA